MAKKLYQGMTLRHDARQYCTGLHNKEQKSFAMRNRSMGIA